MPTTYTPTSCVTVAHQPERRDGGIFCANCDRLLVTSDGMVALSVALSRIDSRSNDSVDDWAKRLASDLGQFTD